VEFSSSSGATLHGWFVPGQPGKGVVVLLHGIRANRWQMLDCAQFLFKAGYSVLLFDFQAHGEIGFSMGGASALLAKPHLQVNAMILESVYPTIEQAVEDRLEARFGWLGKFGVPFLTWQLKPRLGFSANDLCPIQQVGKITTPKFFIAGTEDRLTTLKESKDLFNAAAEPKQFWRVNGAEHIDLDAFVKVEYEKRVLEFLAKNLN
jgi:alpha-beta hydrolase superfamily lysophospholipase